MDSTVEIDDTLLDSCTGTLGRVFVLSSVALACRFCMHVMNRTTVKNAGAVEQYILERKHEDVVITVSNHTSTLDDPCIPSAILPWEFFLKEANHEGVRWVFCARDICFKNALFGCFFRAGKTLPIERGKGPDQPIMDALHRHIGLRGGWLHVFPEGRISFDGKLSDLRWGIGKSVCEIMRHHGRAPVVLPYYHSGMGQVLPYKTWIPRMGHNVHVTFGKPVELDHLTCKCNAPGVDQRQVWRDITRKIQDSLLDLESHSISNIDQVKAGIAPERFVHKRSADGDNGQIG